MVDEDGAILLPITQGLSARESHGGRSVEETVIDLYQKLRPSLLGYVFHLIGSGSEAEDLVQTAFLKFYDQLSQRNEIRNPRGWLYRIVHNLAINHARDTSYREAREEWLGREYLSITGATTNTAEDELINRQRIAQALGALSERERHCLMLRAEGLSYQEIAEALEISPKAVSVYLTRGLKKFETKHETSK